MGRIDWGRVVLGGVVAGVLLFALDAVVHGVLLEERWASVMQSLGRKPSGDSSEGMGWFALYDLCKGLGGAMVYAFIRPRFGPGPKTAVLAGLLVWALVVPIPLCGQLPFQVWGRRLPALWSLYTLLPQALAGLVAGALYREAPSVSARAPA